MRRFVFMLFLVGALFTAGWALYHKDQIQSPGDLFRLAGQQFDRARTALAPARSAGWRSGPTHLIRVASFNTGGLDATRLDNPLVEGVLTRLVTEFDVVALQQVHCDDRWLLQRFLNGIHPDSGQFDFVLGLPGRNEDRPADCAAIIYNRQTIELENDRHYTINDPDQLMARPPLVAWFRTRTGSDQESFTFTLVNLQFNNAESGDEILQTGPVFRAVRNDGRGEDDVILAGDFGASALRLSATEIGGGLSPLIRYSATSTQGDRQSDNLLIDSLATTEFNGEAGVFDFLQQANLTLAEATQVSAHLPVWAEFSATENSRPGRVADDTSGPTVR